jgi:GNAT superfamily N-acetyltransferase
MIPRRTISESSEEPHRPTAGGGPVRKERGRAGKGNLKNHNRLDARPSRRVHVRRTRERDLEAIRELSKVVYPHDEPWEVEDLRRHRYNFPEGQLVAVDQYDRVVGMCASLIISCADYSRYASYDEMTAQQTFDNHDPSGETLYGAEVMVDPRRRGLGIGKKLYEARRELARRFGLVRIRAGARLPQYHQHADGLTARQYVRQVERGELGDSTLSFQLKQGFHVVDVIPGYISRDRQSRGYAALIEWINWEAAHDYFRFRPRSSRALEPHLRRAS